MQKKRGRLLGSKNKQLVVLPPAERPNTRARTRAKQTRNTAAFAVDAELLNNKSWFYYALYSVPNESIYANLKSLEEAIQRADIQK
jgi:hypothetical protein